MRILIIEDEKKTASSLKVLLEKSGHAVDCLTDGETGERRLALRNSDYDFLILDLMLPGKNGVDVCRSLRSIGVTTPILMLTGRNTVEDKIAALDGGADDYLVKPFSFDELSARMRAIQRRPSGTFVKKLKVKDLVLDPGSREVERGGYRIDLTLKEFELLQYLMRNQGQALGREDIFSHLWDFSDNSLSNIIDAHVKNLRKKIDTEGEPTLIETVRGIGYKLRS